MKSYSSNKIFESSSSDSSDKKDDPDYCPTLERPLERYNSINESKEMESDQEIGPSSSKRSRRIGRRLRRTRIRGTPYSLRRSNRRRSANLEKRNSGSESKRTLLSWLIETNIIQQDTKVLYMNGLRDEALKEGTLRREGILCECCNKLFTALEFEVHSGHGNKRPYENIVVDETRISLLSCLDEALKNKMKFRSNDSRREEPKTTATDNHDDACIICADGGVLICCGRCSSTYHKSCMGMNVVPDAWICPYCMCKFCRGPCNTKEHNTCLQCEKRYHCECNSEPIDLNSSGIPLCDKSCKEVFEKLEKMVGVPQDLDEEFSWTLLRVMDAAFGVCSSDLYRVIECDCKLILAMDVMEECFEPIIDRHTKINMLQNIVYNRSSEYIRINFSGFYTAILEKNDEITTVACLRVHGMKLAEMPFIATREKFRSEGMCRRLMIALESTLCYLNVENLVIPSTHEKIGYWIQSYGFQIIEPSLTTELMNWNALTFYDSLRLQKILAIREVREVEEAENNEQQNENGSENRNSTREPFDSNLVIPEEIEMHDDIDTRSYNTE